MPWRTACLLIVAVLVALPLHARFTLEQVMSSPFPTELTAAENSARVAWVF